eukprot:gene1341-386_t
MPNGRSTTGGSIFEPDFRPTFAGLPDRWSIDEEYTAAQKYTACQPDHYGPDCSGVCQCESSYFDCLDSPTGDGSCVCRPGFETQCGGEWVVNSPKCIEEGSLACVVIDPFFYEGFGLETDPNTKQNVRKVKKFTRARVRPSPLKGPYEIVAMHRESVEDIGVSAGKFEEEVFGLISTNMPETVLSVNGRVPTFSHSYGGHQFGRWAGQLGDGRCVSLGHWNGLEVQMKGSGRTPFSRGGDGRSALENSVREFVCSAALEDRSIPSSHAPALLSGSTYIHRDEFYDDKAKLVQAGILFRTAPTFLRFGSVQLAQQQVGRSAMWSMLKIAGQAIKKLEIDGLKQPAQLLLQEAVVDRLDNDLGECPAHELHFDHEFMENARVDPHDCFFRSNQKSCLDEIDWDIFHRSPESIKCVLSRIAHRFAALTAAWNSAGFVHGVLNTDNMALTGITIDLNVFGWVDEWDRAWTPNFIDEDRRYSLGNQTDRVYENIERLLEAVTESSSLHKKSDGDDVKLPLRFKRDILKDWTTEYHRCETQRFAWRFGLSGLFESYVDSVKQHHPPRMIWDFMRTVLGFLEYYQPDYHTFIKEVTNYAIKEDEAYAFDATDDLMCDRLYDHTHEFAPKFVDAIIKNSGARIEPVNEKMMGKAHRHDALLVLLYRYAEVRCMERQIFELQNSNTNHSWVADFKTQVESANPTYVLRNHVLRMLQNKPDRKDIYEVLKVLRDQSPKSEIASQWAERLERAPVGAERKLQTSCGAQ